MEIDTILGGTITTPGKRLPFVDYHLYTDSLSQLPENARLVINTINSHSYCVAEKDKLFKDSLRNCDVLLPDGAGIVWAYKFLYKKKIKKVSGMDLFLFLLNKYRNSRHIERKRVFFLGSSARTLELIKEKMHLGYPEFEVATFSPPFKDAFDDKETTDMIESIADFNPYILFVGMTAPKQEKWVYLNKKDLNANYICNIGAVFDFFAGTTKRPGKFWIENSLEWLARFAKEPRRLWRRVLISNPLFILKMLRFRISRHSALR